MLGQVRDALRLKHYSLRAEQSYVDWIKRYIHFHDKTHPKELGELDTLGHRGRIATRGTRIHTVWPVWTKSGYSSLSWQRSIIRYCSLSSSFIM